MSAPPPPQYLKQRVSENNGLPWFQHPDYIEVCRTISRLGDPTTYNPPHPHGASPTDRTQFSVGLACFNENNLPDVFYQLWPSKEWWDHAKSVKPPQKMDVNGNLMYGRTPRNSAPRAMLDFPILKNLDTISSGVPAWFIELLMRMDGRLDWADILMRIEYPGTSVADESKFRNCLQQRMARARERFSMVSWRDTAGENNAIRDRVLNKLTPAQLAARGGLGSTRGSTPGSTDSQGRVIPIPGRRARGTAITGNTATQVQQLQGQTAGAGPSNAFSQQNYPVTYTGFSAVNSQQNQPSESHGGSRTNQQNLQTNSANIQHQYSAAASYADHSHQTTLPIMGDRRAPNAVSTTTQQNQPSASYVAIGCMQQVQNTTSYAGPEANEYSQHHASHADPLSDEYVQTVTSHAGASTGQQDSPEVPFPYSSEGSDGDDEDDESDESDDGDDSEGIEDEENDKNEGDEENDGNEEPDAEMPLAREDNRVNALSAELRREVERYLEEGRIRIEMYENGIISGEEMMSGMVENAVQFSCGMKRVRGEISGDDEVEEMQIQRVKRTKRGGDAAGLSGQPLSETQRPHYSGFDNPQPGPSGEYNRQGALAYTSRRPATRPVGSAVQRLHNDRARRPVPKATIGQKENHESLYPQPENAGGIHDYHVYLGLAENPQSPDKLQEEDGMADSNDYTHIGEPQPRPLSSRQRQPGSERFSSALNPMVEDIPGDTPANAPHSPPESYHSHDAGNTSNPVESARNDAHTAPHRAYQQPTASTVQDDPFFSDELFNGMLNGQPDVNHVGSMYTRSQQLDIDEYYQRVMASRPRIEPENDTAENVIPPPPQFREEELQTLFVADLLNPYGGPQGGQGGGAPHQHVPNNVPGAPVQGGNAQPVAQVPPGAPQPAAGSNNDLVVRDIAGWDSAWSAFINNHNNKPLLRGHYPDEYPKDSRSRRPPG